MKLLARTFDTLNLLHVRFDNEGTPMVECVVCSVRKGKISVGEPVSIPDITTEKSRLSKALVIMAVSGKGVVTKEASAEGIVETVTSDPATFLWTRNADGSISFVRHARLKHTLSALAEAGIVPLGTECLPDDTQERLVAEAWRFWSERLKWKAILKPSAEGSQLAQLFAKRLMLPVLGTVLLALMVNFILSSRVRDEFKAAGSELAALEKSASSAAASSESRRAALEGFSRTLPYRFSWLGDRIAAATPEKVILNELSVAPIIKGIEAGKPVRQNERTVVIRGESSSPEAIASFAGALGELSVGTVALSSVEQDREQNLLTFTIEMKL